MKKKIHILDLIGHWQLAPLLKFWKSMPPR
jgi:hypothetical protein